MTSAAPIFRPDLLARYDAHGPRYTSYPTAVQFTDSFDPAHYREAARNGSADADLSALLPYPVLRYRLLLLRLQQDRDEEPARMRARTSTTSNANWRCSQPSSIPRGP